MLPVAGREGKTGTAARIVWTANSEYRAGDSRTPDSGYRCGPADRRTQSPAVAALSVNLVSKCRLIFSDIAGITGEFSHNEIRYNFFAGEIHMTTKATQTPEDLEQREFQLSLFAASAIAVLAAGLATLMYPAVFANRDSSRTGTPQIAFYGFCILSCLLVTYIVDRQLTIHRLRKQMALERKLASDALQQASADRLTTMPNVITFDDRLTMEFRRASTAGLRLSVMVISVKLNPAFAEPGVAESTLGDAASAVSHKLREQDSIFILRPAYFEVIVPGVGQSGIDIISGRISESLTNASGPSKRFSFKIDIISYPEQTSSALDLELAVSGWLPETDSLTTVADGAHKTVSSPR
jgi:GGDEF domain-containing protein